MSKMFPGSDPGAPIAVMGHGFPDIADWLLGGDLIHRQSGER